MPPIAPHSTAFVRERFPQERGASAHTCDSYAYTLQLLCTFASQRLPLQPSARGREQLDAALVMDFLAPRGQQSLHEIRGVSRAVQPGAKPPDPGDSHEEDRSPFGQSSLHGGDARHPGCSRCADASGPPGAGHDPSLLCRGAAGLGTPDVTPDGLALPSDPDGADPRERTTGTCAPSVEPDSR